VDQKTVVVAVLGTSLHSRTQEALPSLNWEASDDDADVDDVLVVQGIPSAVPD
jgi:hypothetical protein